MKGREFTFGTTLSNGKSVSIVGKHYRATAGARDSLGGIRGAGPALEPDEPAEFVIEKIEDAYGEVSVSEEEEERLCEMGIDKVEEKAAKEWEEYNTAVYEQDY